MSEKLPKAFWEIHSGLPREGPGDDASTEKAFLMLCDLPRNPRILDVGCGPGMQTLKLARLSGGRIDALDNHQPFLDALDKRARAAGLSQNIRTVKGDMLDLDYPDGSFDVVWSEGSIFVIGFERGLRVWRRLLPKMGYLVVSEMSWFREDLPDEVKEFMKNVSPDIKSIKENLDVAQKNGYSVVGSFVLPEQGWWTSYYTPIEAKLPALKVKFKDDGEALQVVGFAETEIAMFRKYSKYYGYVFYVLQIA